MPMDCTATEWWSWGLNPGLLNSKVSVHKRSRRSGTRKNSKTKKQKQKPVSALKGLPHAMQGDFRKCPVFMIREVRGH